MAQQQTTERPITEYPVYWFAQLEQAIERGNLREAANAQRRLKRMGIDVKFEPRSRPEVARA